MQVSNAVFNNMEHPLFKNETLHVLFSNFKNDPKDLASFRLVCKPWNQVASNYMKHFCTWQIGPRGSNKGPEQFTKIMENCASKLELFKNFHLYDLESLGHAGFLNMFGPTIVDLKLQRIWEPEDIEDYLWKLPHLRVVRVLRRGIYSIIWYKGMKMNHEKKMKKAKILEDYPRQFPDCMGKEELTVTNQQLCNSFDFDLCGVKHLKLHFTPYMAYTPLIPPATPHKNVAVLNCVTSSPRWMARGTAKFLVEIFPGINELHVVLENDAALRAIISGLPGLRKLHLGDSLITDTGITGIPWNFFRSWCIGVGEELDNATSKKILQIVQESFKKTLQTPTIDDLKGLEEFTFSKNSLSKYSVRCGFANLKKLSYIKLPPFCNVGNTFVKVEKVDVRSLVEGCPALRKVDVRGRIYTLGVTITADRCHPISRGYSGLDDEDIEFVKERVPGLKIVFDY